MSTEENISVITGTKLPFTETEYRDGTEHVDDTARVMPSVTLKGHPQVRDMARVFNMAKVLNRSRVLGQAEVHDRVVLNNHALVYGTARIYAYSVVDGGDVGGNVYMGECARVRNVSVTAGNLDLTADVDHASHVLSLGPIGSENRTVTFYRAYEPTTQSWVGIIAAGCFRGTTERLTARLDEGNGWSKYSYNEATIARYDTDYRAFIEMCKAREATWAPINQGDIDWWVERLSDPDRAYMVTRLADYTLPR